MRTSHYGNLRSLTERCLRRLCGFEWEGNQWSACANVLFRPSALMLWDVPDRALVSYAIVGNRMQITASPVPVPARFFMTGHSFEEVVRRFEREGIEAPFWCDFDTMDLGTRFCLRVVTEQGEPVRSLQAVLLGLGAFS